MGESRVAFVSPPHGGRQCCSHTKRDSSRKFPSLISASMLFSPTSRLSVQKQPTSGAHILTRRHHNLGHKQKVEFLVHLEDCL